jgi:uncharacterized protein (TIGR04255 family)
MTKWTYVPPNPITSFLVGVELSGPIPSSTMKMVASMHPQYKKELPRRLEHPSFSFGAQIPFFGQAGSPLRQNFAFPGPPELGALVFDRVQEDGTVGKALTIGPNRVTYMTSSYSRWEEFHPVSDRIVKDIAQLALPDVNATAIILAVTNQFRLDGPVTDEYLRSLLNEQSKYVASNMMSCPNHCHSFHGYLTKLSDPVSANYIRNANVNTADDGDEKRVVNIVFTHTAIFETPLGADSHLFEGVDKKPSVFSAVCNLMHESNNELFLDVLNPAISTDIPGLSRNE